MNNAYLELLNAAQIFIIMGWFWLIMFTIFRAENFKKRYFTVLMLIYAIQGITGVSSLLQLEYVTDVITPMTIFSNALSIFGFGFLTLRYIKFKDYYNEKINHLTINGIVYRDVMHGPKSSEN